MEDQKNIIALGHEATIFINSNLGKYITERSNIEIETAMSELVKVNAGDTEKILYWQNVIRMHQKFNQWLDDAAFAGDVAYSEYLSSEE